MHVAPLPQGSPAEKTYREAALKAVDPGLFIPGRGVVHLEDVDRLLAEDRAKAAASTRPSWLNLAAFYSRIRRAVF